MRLYVLSLSFAASCLLAPVMSEKPPPLPPYRWMKDILAGKEEYSSPGKRDAGQERLMDPPSIVLPPSGDDDSRPNPPESSGGLTISDVISSERRINIFSGFTRDIETVAKRLEDASQNSTILAPDNPHLMKLPRKPWEDPEDYNEFGAEAYTGNDGEDRAHKNLRRFTEAHVVPSSPLAEGEKVETLAGNKIWFESKDGKTFVQPGNVEVDSVAKRVSNGEIWILKGVLNYP